MPVTLDPAYSGPRLTLSNGNLTVTTNAPNDGNQHGNQIRATEGKTSGKWYFECHIDTMAAAAFSLAPAICIGINGYRWQGRLNASDQGILGNQDFGNPVTARSALVVSSRGQWQGNNTGDGFINVLPTLAAGDRIDIAVDVGARLIWCRRNGGSWNPNNTGANPATGAGGQPFENTGGGANDTLTLGSRVWPAVSLAGYQDKVTLNFGATSFVGTPPSGFAAWSSTYSYVGNLGYASYLSLSLVSPPNATTPLWVGDFTPSASITVNTLLVSMMSSSAASYQAIIYDATGSGGAPGNLVFAGPLTYVSGTPGFELPLGSNVTLTAGVRYYVGYFSGSGNQQGSTSPVTTLGWSSLGALLTLGSPPPSFPTPTATTGSAAPAVELILGPTPTVHPSLALDTVLAFTTAAVVSTSSLIFLDWSDDRGHSYGNPVGQPIGATGAYLTSVQWQRLAYARDRVFRLTWSVPVATALQGAWIEIDASPKS